MAESPQHAPPRTIAVVAAFAAVYLIWGSTYLAIRFAIETIPPFAMAGIRHLLAGIVLYAWLRSRVAERPTIAQWRSATIVGALLLVGGNGAVVWAEQRVATGPASLIVAMVPLWMVVLEWARPRGVRPSAWVLAGIALGLAGITLLVGPGTFAGGEPIDRIGASVLVLGSFSWAMGSLYSRRATLPSTPLLGTAMELLGGGVILILIATITGEWRVMAPGAVSIKSVSALLYLVVFGSLVGFTCYIWLLRVSTPARVSTYAYVNPVVAVVLGWAFAGEPLTARTALAAVTIVGAVALITIGQRAGPGTRGPRWRERVKGRERGRGKTAVSSEL